jgi:hypothetical protein
MNKQIIYIYLVLLCMGSKISFGQCDNATLYPTATTNVVCGANSITAFQYAGEYNVTAGYPDKAYLTFKSSLSSDYISIRKVSDNAVIASGYTPLSLKYSTAYGQLEMHLNKDSLCSNQNTTRATSVDVFCGCDNASLYPAAVTLAQCGGPYTITTAQYAGEYNVSSFLTDNADVVFASSVPTDHITLRRADNNAVLSTGVGSAFLAYSVVYGAIEMHISKDINCATESVSRTTTYTQLCGCNFPAKYPNNNVLANCGLTTMATSQYAGEYNVTYGYEDQATCVFSSSGSTDYVTLRKASDKTILKTGPSPQTLVYNPSFGAIEMHVSKGFFCGTENINRTSTVNVTCPLIPIYAGGIDDGFDFNGFAQADNPPLPLYAGGIDDGFDFNSFAQADNPLLPLYAGGIDDGFDYNSFAEPDNPLLAIYTGGIDDGFDFNSFAQVDNPLLPLYAGGIDDGFDFNSYIQCNGNKLLWLGTVSSDWFNPLNWECNQLPNINSEVVIPSIVPHFPTVSAASEIRKLTLLIGANFAVLPGVAFKVNGF